MGRATKATKTNSRAARVRALSLVLRAALPAVLVALALVPATGQRPEGFGALPPDGQERQGDEQQREPRA